MTTFGVYFKKLRQQIEKTGRTDAACGDMDGYKDRRRTELSIHLDREDRGWELIANQELSHSNLLEFSAEMTRAGAARLYKRACSDSFDPETFSLTIDSVHEFHHAMLKVADECGLDVHHLSGWLDARAKKNAA